LRRGERLAPRVLDAGGGAVEACVLPTQGGPLAGDHDRLLIVLGADVERSTTLILACGAVAALRATVILGRAGELGGRLAGTLRVTNEGGVVLHDALRLDPVGRIDDQVALPPGHRVATTLCFVGPDAQDEAQLALAHGGALRRATGRELADLEAELARPWARWTSAAVPTALSHDRVSALR